MYTIEYKKAALKILAKMPGHTVDLIRRKIRQLAKNPHAPNNNVIKMVVQGDNIYRLRVGDWRVIYKIDNGVLKILVLTIGPRGDVYKQL